MPGWNWTDWFVAISISAPIADAALASGALSQGHQDRAIPPCEDA